MYVRIAALQRTPGGTRRAASARCTAIHPSIGGGRRMQGAAIGTTFRMVGYLVLLLMAAAMVYAGAITVTYWRGIGV
jgi:hypothetical protein